jgi:hypothetical protein
VRLPDPARSAAVLIGTGGYRHSDLPDLPAVANNVRDLADALTDPTFGALLGDRCTVLADPVDPAPCTAPCAPQSRRSPTP